MGMITGFAAIALATTGSAQQSLQSVSAVYVERMSTDTSARLIEPAQNLRRGDKVILVVEWQSTGRPGDLTVSSTIPKQLAFQRASQDAYAVSVDGGRTWGRIGALKIAIANGSRMASVEDVTHLQWRVPSTVKSGRKGRITYSAIVR
ncbi:MAG: hypothetical protein WAT93_13530 [Pontixanthobacter sp.]